MAASIRHSLPARLPGVLAKPDRRFWLIVGLIILGGAIARLLVHDYDLPWIGYIDELFIYLFGKTGRGLALPLEQRDASIYPPLFVWLHFVVQPWAEAQGRVSAVATILDLRRLVMLANIAGICWIAYLGHRCGGALAGVLAAILWAFTIVMLDTPAHAIGESLVYPFLILSLLLAVLALEPTRRWQLALASLGVALLCFLLEYRLLVAFFPGAVALIRRAHAHFQPDRRQLAIWTGAGLVLAIAAGVVALMLLPARFRNVAAETLGQHLWDLPALVTTAEFTLKPLDVQPIALIFLLAPLAWWVTRQRGDTPLKGPPLLLTAATLVLVLWADSAIRPYSSGHDLKIRHAISVIALLYVLAAAAVAQLTAALPGPRLRSLAVTGAVTYLLLLLLGPALEFVQQRRILPWPVIVRRWVDSNLEPGTILIYHDSERWFNPLWGGIPHRQWFDWLETEDVLERPLEEWIDTHLVTWLALPVHQQGRLQDSAEGRAFLAQLLPLRAFVHPPARREPEVILYRLWRMQHESDVRFSEHIRLVGYDLHTPDARPGEELAFTLYWNATAAPPENYSFFLHLVGAGDARPLAQLDGNPAVPERLTQTWDRPDETLISPRFNLTLPPDLAPGDYRVLLGLYNFETGERLPARDAAGAASGDTWELTHLHIDGTRNDTAAAD